MKVLVVEDAGVVRLSIKKALEEKGITVVEAETGKNAIRAFMREMPDVISMDIGLPDGNGLELLKEIKSMCKNINKDIKCLILSGLATQENIIKAYQIGVIHVFTKPIDANEYANYIKSLK